MNPAKMLPLERKKVSLIAKYAVEAFTAADWLTLGQITGRQKTVTDHPRLLRALGFGDDDYEVCAAEVLETVFAQNVESISEVIDHFDIDLWYQQKSPDKYLRIFPSTAVADFWKDGYLRVFVSHLSSNKERMSAMKSFLGSWGISAFIAHEDIEPSREWRDEVEAGLESMDVLVAVVEPGFKESEWCAQEVGFALGRKVDVLPLRAGMDPFGFFGKYQGIQIKGKVPEIVADEVTQLLLRKPKFTTRLLQGMGQAFEGLPSPKKIKKIELLESWSVLSDDQIRGVVESSSLSQFEKKHFKSIIARVGAFQSPTPAPVDEADDALPF